MPATQIAEAFSERLGNGRSADALPEPRNTDPLHAPERDRNEAVIMDCGNGSLYRSAVRNAASTVIENLLVSRSFIPVYMGESVAGRVNEPKLGVCGARARAEELGDPGLHSHPCPFGFE